jgi:hypothetical protein
MRAIVIVVEGVLRKLTDGTPIREGIELVANFTGERDALVFLTNGRWCSASSTEDWLQLQGLRADLVLKTEAVHSRSEELHILRNNWSYHVDLVIEPDPDICADLVANGHTTLGFFHPHYSQAEWRPDFKPEVRPWAELSTQVANGAALRAQEHEL